MTFVARLKPDREMWFVTLMTLAWVYSLWVNSFQDFTWAEAAAFFCYCLGLLLLAGLLHAALARLRPWLGRLFLVLFLVFAVTSLMLNFVDAFATLDAWQRWGILAGVGLGFYLLLDWLASLTKAPWLLYGLLALFFVQNSVNLGLALQTDVPDVAPTHAGQEIEFARKPNVYLVSFDALIPYSIASRFLGMDEVQYVKAIQASGMQVLKNVFSDGSTISTMNSLVVLDAKEYWKLPNPNSPITDVNSLLYRVFRGNGYKIQLVTKNNYLGSKEHSLDVHYIAENQGACEHVHDEWGLLGFCNDVVSSKLSHLEVFASQRYPEALFRRIRQVAKSKHPWLTIAYVHSPGHVHPRKYLWPRDFDSYRDKFANQKDQEAADYIRSLIQQIQKVDPHAVLVIFGDHGTHYSRSVAQTGKPPQDIQGLMTGELAFSPDLIEEVQDHHGVLMAVYPADFCQEEFSQAPYALIRMGRSIIKCLSGKDPLPATVQPNDEFLQPYLYE